MLLNLASLAHASRTAFWRQTPPARIYAVDSVVCWPDAKQQPPKHFTQHRYSRIVWQPCHIGPSSFWWLSGADFKHVPAAA